MALLLGRSDLYNGPLCPLNLGKTKPKQGKIGPNKAKIGLKQGFLDLFQGFCIRFGCFSLKCSIFFFNCVIFSFKFYFLVLKGNMRSFAPFRPAAGLFHRILTQNGQANGPLP